MNQPQQSANLETPVDAVESLAAIGEQLQRIQREPGRRLVEMIDAIEAADWSGKELLDELQRRFLAAGQGQESDEQIRVWKAVSSYLLKLVSAYLLLVRLFQTYSRGWAEVGDRLPLLIARALRITGMRMKWMRMRYQPFDRKAWKTLSQLWSYVEDKGFARARVLVYEDRSTVQCEFAKPLIFAISAIDSLPAEEIDVAYRLISHVAGQFDVQRYPTRGCHFFIDVDQWTVPARHHPGNAVRLGSRFFGPGDAVAELEQISANLAAEAISVSDINLQDVADVEMIIDVLAHLERHWSPTRPERRDQRRRKVSKIAVVLGHTQVLQRIAGNDTSVAPGDDEGVESWDVANESEAGYGALVPSRRGETLQIGQLVGARPAGSRMWAVGVIRRLAAQEPGQRYVGIELLGRGVQAVGVNERGSGRPDDTALLLPSHIGDSMGLGEIHLLLPKGTFSPDAAIDMTVYETNYELAPLMVLETGDSFEVGRYRITERE